MQLQDWADQMEVAGSFEIIEYLVLKGADIHIDNDYCIRHAKYLDMVEYLVLKGADIHANNDEALRTSSKKHNFEVIRYLILHGANIHANNDEALRNACMIFNHFKYENEMVNDCVHFHRETIKYLLLSGANIDNIGPHSECDDVALCLVEKLLKARRKIRLIRNINLLQRFVLNYNVIKYVKYIPGVGVNYIDALNHFET